MKFEVFVTLKNEVLDPQGKAVENALKNIGFDQIHSVRQGKYFTLDIDEKDESKAKASIEKSCEKLLANLTIENFKVKKIG